ncbi:MAG: hypothetical protein QM813_20140 [Verrucomicrobiota bacterium]
MKHEMTRELGIGNKTIYPWAWHWAVLAVAILSVGGVATSLQAQTSWTNLSGSADWFTAGSWSAGVPTLADEASLSAARIIRITSTNQVATAGLLNINSGGLDIAKGTLNVAGALQVNGTSLSLSGANVSFDSLWINSGAPMPTMLSMRGDTGRQQRQH